MLQVASAAGRLTRSPFLTLSSVVVVLSTYQFAPKLDTYAGLMLSYDIVSSNYDAFSNYIKSSHIDWSLFLGARYFFTEKIGCLR